MGSSTVIPPPPAGFKLDSATPPPPPGFTLDSAPKELPSQQSMDAAFIQRMKAMPKGTKPAPTWEGSDRNIMDARSLSGALPAAGMTAGSMVGALGGPPGAMAGAMVGGAAGEYAREKVEGEKTSAGSIYDTGVTAGLADVAGGIALKGVEKGIASVSPKATAKANVLIDRLLKPNIKKLIGGTTSRVGTANEIAGAVNNVAGDAKTLPQLKEKVDSAIEDLTLKTQKIVDSYAAPWRNAPISGGQANTTAPQLGAGTDVIPGTALSAGGAAAQPGATTAKMYTKQGGIPLKRILQSSARKTAGELSATEVADKEKVVTRLAQMVYQHAGKQEITPSEALDLRRWMYSNVKWPKAALGMRDDIYSALNHQIEAFLQPEDAAAFRANNAQVHRLLKGRDAIDIRTLAQNRQGAHITHRWWILPLIGSSAGGGLGYAAGGGKGAAEGAAMGAGLGEIGSIGFGLAESPTGLLGRAALQRGIAKGGAKAAETVIPLSQEARKMIFGMNP